MAQDETRVQHKSLHANLHKPVPGIEPRTHELATRHFDTSNCLIDKGANTAMRWSALSLQDETAGNINPSVLRSLSGIEYNKTP